jgi:hypothetical protein
MSPSILKKCCPKTILGNNNVIKTNILKIIYQYQ